MKTTRIIFVSTALLIGAGVYACKTPGNQTSKTANARDKNVAHRTDKFYVAGEFDFAKDVIPRRYGGVPVQRFGTVTPIGFDGQPLKMRDGREKVVRDLHYPLNDTQSGMRPIPVVDGDQVAKTADGTDVRGSEIMDAYLRKEMGLNDNDPIFALIGYVHPEMHKGNFQMMADQMLKLEGGQTHLGAYIGNGKTRNSPYSYHNMKWGIRGGSVGYPANVTIVSLDGVPQAVLNLNAQITLRLLNELNGGVKFPADYKFDWFRAINLKETLDFYHGWLDKNWKRNKQDAEPFQRKLLNDSSYHTYCAEHITIALNAALNVPQNLKGYKDVWGETEGPILWQIAQTKYKEISGGQDMPEVPAFTPLWKRDDMKLPTRTLRLGAALAWPAETTADLAADFISVYAAWPDVGAPTSAMLTLGFGPTAAKRMGIPMKTFYDHVKDFVVPMFISEASTIPFKNSPDASKAFDEYVEKSLAGFVKLVQGGKTQEAWTQADSNAPKVEDLVPEIRRALEQIKAKTIKSDQIPVDKAWANFSKAIKKDLEEARKVDVKSSPNDPSAATAKFVQFYSPPAVLHRIINGMHPGHPAVKLRTVATAIDPQDVVRKSSSDMTEYDVYQN